MTTYKHHLKEEQHDPLPILVYCELISHRTEVIHETDYLISSNGNYEYQAYEVPEKVLVIPIYVHTYTEESIWASLNKYGYFSRTYKLASYWQPEPIQDEDCPF